MLLLPERLELVRGTAATGRLHVGVLDREPGPQHVVVHVVDLAARQIRRALAVHKDPDPMGLDDAVVLAGRIIPPQLVRHARAAAADNANAQAQLGLALFEPPVGALLRRHFSQTDHAILLGISRGDGAREPAFSIPELPEAEARRRPRGPRAHPPPPAGGCTPPRRRG